MVRGEGPADGTGGRECGESSAVRAWASVGALLPSAVTQRSAADACELMLSPSRHGSSPRGTTGGWPRPLLNPVENDEELAKKLWELSEKLVKDATTAKGCL